MELNLPGASVGCCSQMLYSSSDGNSGLLSMTEIVRDEFQISRDLLSANGYVEHNNGEMDNPCTALVLAMPAWFVPIHKCWYRDRLPCPRGHCKSAIAIQ